MLKAGSAKARPHTSLLYSLLSAQVYVLPAATQPKVELLPTVPGGAGCPVDNKKRIVYNDTADKPGHSGRGKNPENQCIKDKEQRTKSKEQRTKRMSG